MKPIIFGMPTLLEHDRLEDGILLCEKLGLSFIEINMNLPDYQTGRMDVDELRSAFDRGIMVTFHLDENLNIADFNGVVANAYLETVVRTIEIAKRVGSPILNMHMNPGVYFKLPDRKVDLFERYKTHYMDRIAQFRETCEREIGDYKLLVCIENCSGFKPFMREGVDYLLESPVFALTLDIGHMYSAGDADEAFMKARQDRIAHMHIHDAIRQASHLPLNCGQIDLADRLNLARSRDCRCVLEIKSVNALIKSVDYLKERSWMNP